MRATLSLMVLPFLILASQPANAEERWPRWYVGLSAGVDFIEEIDLSGSLNGDLDTDTAFAFTGSLGYMPYFDNDFLDAFRIEAEMGIRQGGLDSFTNAGVSAAARENMRVVSYMANLIYDFDMQSQWTPYLGAGIGGASVHLSENSGLGNISDKDTVLAYQFLAGLTYAPSSIPLTEWGVGYRYFTADSPEFATTGASRLKLDDFTSHGIEANARFRF